MTTPRKIFAAVALASVALFTTAGLAMADPNEVDDGGHHGGHSNSHTDGFHLGDDNECNFKYKRDGSRNHKFDGDNDDCPPLNPQVNEPNPAYTGGSNGSGGFSIPGL
ncbi:MAG TPA: hypothetical protein VL595_12375 [Pseudonocardia sp.]|nr:hypothetical protein [Pseudonocardia sp.]